MQSEFKALSLSHQNASLAIREKMHLDADACDRLATNLHEILGLEEVLILSTCNRTEVYYLSEEDKSKEVIRLLCLEKGISTFEILEIVSNLKINASTSKTSL